MSSYLSIVILIDSTLLEEYVIKKNNYIDLLIVLGDFEVY